MTRLARLCVIEAVIVVMLAMQVFTGTGPPDIAGQPRPDLPASPAASLSADSASSTAPTAPTMQPLAATTRSEVAPKWNAGDPVGVLLMGSVRLRDGKPADAWITLSRGTVHERASADVGGSYALLRLTPGEWSVALSGESIVAATESLVLTDDAVQHRDFVVDPSFPVHVSIVTADGDDGTTALRTATSWNDFFVAGQREPFPTRLAPTDYDAVFVGDARWSGERNPKDGFAGTLYLSSVPAYVALLQRHLVLEQKLVQAGQDTVSFVVDVEDLKKLAGSAAIRVLDEAGAPLTTARVSLNTSNRGSSGQTVDAEGHARLDGLSPGLLRLAVNAPERETMVATVRVESGQHLDLGEVRLGAAIPLTGTMLGADGKPAAADLTWTELKWRTAPTAFSTNRTAAVDAEGKFSLWGTGRGAIAVSARTRDGMVAAGVFDNPPPTPIVLRLAKACDCTVTRPADLTRAFTVTLFAAGQRAIAARTLEPRTPKATISLPAGDYPFEVHDDQARVLQSGVLTFGDAPCALEIR